MSLCMKRPFNIHSNNVIRGGVPKDEGPAEGGGGGMAQEQVQAVVDEQAQGQGNEQEEEEEEYLLKGAPADFVCPITFKLMTDPVNAFDGRVSQ